MATTWTSTDKTNLKNAIMALVQGQRVVSAAIGGKLMRYAETDLPSMRSLLAEMTSELNTATRKKFYRVTTSKGL